MRVLFVASLHHPERLQEEIANTPQGETPPIMPTSMSQYFMAKAFQKRGYEVDVFWRNLSAWAQDDINTIRAHVHSEAITPAKIMGALMRRLPIKANPDYRGRNANLLNKVREFKPDILWLSGGNRIIYPETLAQIRNQYNCKILYVNGVSPIVFSHAIERESARLYDWVLVNDYYHGIQWQELGAPNMACLPYVAIDPDEHYPYLQQGDLSDAQIKKYTSDVAFVGTLTPHHLYSERRGALEAIADFSPSIWSVHDVPQSLKPFMRGSALGKEMMHVLSCAKISLNIHGDFMRYGGNMRLFESAAVGAFQIVDDRPGISEWFTIGEHLVTFKDHDDLRDKITYYLTHDDERQRIAQNAIEHVRQHHTYQHRVSQVEDLLGLPTTQVKDNTNE